MNKLSGVSREWVKKNKKEIIGRFIGENKSSENKAFTVFMAGSPGAGKTETSKAFIANFKKANSEAFIARIDPDEIREIIPGYSGSNSDLFQSASSLGVEKLYDYVLKNNINAVIDGTLASYNVAYKNIGGSIKKNRITAIFYVYQDPLVAWRFTKIREKVEGRRISREVFIESFFSAKENVNKLKKVFGDKIRIFLIIKNFQSGMDKFHFNIDKVDNYLKIKYDKQSLNKKLC